MTARTTPVTFTPLLSITEVGRGDDLAVIVLTALRHNEIQLQDGDILVVSSKVASKAMGLRAPLDELADVVLSQTVRVVAERMAPSGVVRIVESAAGPVMAAAGVDASNTGSDSTGEWTVLVLPDDPDAVAAGIKGGVQDGWASISGTHLRIGVILSDTAGRPWRTGQVDIALGAAGIHVMDDLRGSTDTDGRVLLVTQRCIADEIAAAADLVKGKVSGIPVAHVRGLGQFVRDGDTSSGAREIVRTGAQDWFGHGALEAVRAALGVPAGSPTASEIGIPSVTPEEVATRAGRALRAALLTCPGASGRIDSNTVRLAAADDFALGVVATRAEVALHGEGLTTTLTRGPVRPPTPTAPPTPTGQGAQGASLTPQPGVHISFQ